MQPDISVVVPMKNEAPNVEELYRELKAALEACGRSYEILAIDDGSTDDTFARLARLQAADDRLRVIRFRRNFGQTAAFAAGFAHARGRYIVTMDGDLQNDPRDIAAMVKELEQHPADIVAGWRKDRKDKFFSRRLPSMVANRIISKATGVRLHDYGCSLKVFRAEVVKPMKLYGEMHRFLPAIASEFGVTTVERVVNHRARQHGASKYGLSRTIRVILDLLTVKFLISYRTRPVQIFGLWGLVMGLLGAVILTWLAYVRLTTVQAIGDRPLLLLGILLISTGVQLVMLGLLAEMQARTYHESQDKPTYVIREVLQGNPEQTVEGDDARVTIKRFR
jgi:glycosyltransferase involved in cell wall biosynthesis